jgi:hypothetical protein
MLHTYGSREWVTHRRLPSLMTGIVAPAPDGSEPAVDMTIEGRLRCMGPYERATVSGSGTALSGDWTRPLTPAEGDALVREWAASGRGPLWMRDWALHPSAAARLTWHGGVWFALGLIGIGAWAVTLTRVGRAAAAMRRHRLALWRGRRGLCPSCGYELRGAAAARCPECGADPAEAVAAAERALSPYSFP